MLLGRFPGALLAGLVVVASLAASTAGGSLSADTGGLPLFGEPTSVWRIAAGYNTATHIGDDPHALDLVRVDAPTTGSVVHAPVTGRLGFVSSECLTIEDALGNEILLCHLFPAAGLARGTLVSTGDVLGTVAPPGFAGNNGLAHIHLAVHETLGDGRLLGTLPFSGPYALEGRDLASSSQAGEYAGLEFVSTNGLATPTSPSLSGTEGPEIDSPIGAPYATSRTLFPGWNLITWPTAGPISTDDEKLPAEVRTVFGFDGPTQRFLHWNADVPVALNTLTAIPAGLGTFVFSVGEVPVPWALPADLTSPTVALEPGFNLVTWHGPDASVAEAIGSLGDAFVALHAFDGAQQAYASFHVGVPGPLNSLRDLEPKQAVWIEVSRAVDWIPPGGEAPFPTETVPPVEEADPSVETITTLFVLGPGCLNLRAQPTTINNTPITCMSVGTRVEGFGSPQLDGDGREWLRVTFHELQGWAAAEFLRAGGDPFSVHTITGEATFYHPSLTGDPMFCGGIYDPGDATIAASTNWPCGTRLRLLTTESSIDVIVQDTGLLAPMHIDLSEAAFEMLAPLSAGRIAIVIEVIP